MIWTNGSVLFPFGTKAPASLPTTLCTALKPDFHLWQPQRAQTTRLMPTPFSKLFAGLGSTIKTATSLPFLKTFPLCLLRFLLLRSSFYLTLSRISGRNQLLFSLPQLSGYYGYPVIQFSRKTSRPIIWKAG